MSGRLVPLLAVSVLLGACGGATTGAGGSSASPAGDPSAAQVPDDLVPLPGSEDEPEQESESRPSGLGDRVRVRVVDRRPHDTSAFTQGLEFHDGRLFESRGLYGESAMTEIDPETGEVIARTDLSAEFFGEGATVVGDEIVQITWRESTAFVYDRDTLETTGTFSYTGEGWGICDEPDRLLMSNGTPVLTHRDPATFEALEEVTVTLDGVAVDDLNELECVDGLVWANVWQTDLIVVVDPETGEVVTEVDASGLLTPEERAQADVLNGIAYDPLTDTWLLTGKRWPWMFEVEFECVAGCETAAVPTPTNFHRPGGTWLGAVSG